MIKNSSISVIIPIYNRANVLRRALKSVMEQTLAPHEIIVVDDGSDDDPFSVAQNICDSRLNYICFESNKNAAFARNAGAEVATGDYLAFLDSDDQWLPDHLESKVRCLQSSPEAQAVFGSFLLQRETGEQFANHLPVIGDEENMATYILERPGGDIRTSTMVVKRGAFSKVKFDAELGKHQDWDFAIRFDDRFSWVLEREPTAVMFISSADRMSGKPNHQATKRFLEKHSEHFSSVALSRMCTSMAVVTLFSEGRSPNFQWYYDRIQWSPVVGKRTFITKTLLSLPFAASSIKIARWLARWYRFSVRGSRTIKSIENSIKTIHDAVRA